MLFLSIVFIVIGCLTILIFLNKADNDGFDLSGITNYEITGQFGDFVGGVVGTLFALSGTFLIFLTFNEQKKENQRISHCSNLFAISRLFPVLLQIKLFIPQSTTKLVFPIVGSGRLIFP